MPEETPAVKVPLLGISIEGKFNQSRSVVFQTHFPLDTDTKELYKKFSEVCEIMDRREEFYLLKGLKITLERDEATYKNQAEMVANLEQAYQNEWDTSRRGPFKLAGQQKTNIENQRGSLKALKERIEKVKSEIRELEELQKAYE